MIIALTIFAEFFFVSFLIIGFYKLKPRYGLVPLFVLIGSNQFLQTILATTFYVKLYGQYVVSPGATILFCSSLFTILLIYIKEGVFITQRLILGILLSNFTFNILSWITSQQSVVMNDIMVSSGAAVSLFKTNFRVFFVGTIVLLFDALIIVILYEYFFVKQKWLNLYGRLLLTMLLVFNFDAAGFTLGSFWEKPGLENRLIGQMLIKSVAAVFFASVLWIFLRYLDKDKKRSRSKEPYGKEDIFSILTYRSKYERLITEKAISEEQLQKAITAKTRDLEQEIKARKLAEEEIVREKELSDSLINSLPGVFYLYTEEGKFLRWNKNFETVTGYSAAEMRSSHPLDFFAGEEKDLLEQKIKNVFIAGEDNVAALFADKWGNLTPYYFTGKVINYGGIRCLMGVGIDISERAKVEAALAKSEERFRTLIEQAAEGIFISNPTYQFTLVNNSGCKMLGYTQEEILEMKIQDITILEKGSPSFRFDELREGKSVIQERIFRHKDGSLVPVEISAKMLLNGDLLAFVRDISERKKYQESLQQSEQNLRQVLTSITDIFYVIDRQYRITLMNKTAAELLPKAWGVPIETGKNIFELIPAESNEPVRESFAKVFAGESVEYEYYQHSSLIEGWYLINYHPVFSEDKEVIGAYVVTKDITEKKKAEELIQQNNERFELIGKAANDALWEWNLETNEIWGNETHQQLYGLTLADPVPDDEIWRKNLHEDDKQRIFDSLDEVFASDKNIWDGEYRLFTVNKGWMNVYGRTYIERNAAGKPIRMLGSMMDITERKESERKLMKEKQLSDSIINSLPGVFYLFDDTPRFLRWNKNFEQISGYSFTELATMAPMSLFDENDRIIMRKQIEKARKEGYANAETSLVTKTGEKIPFFFTGVSIIYEGKNCILGNGVDISERKKSEEEILEINKQLRNLSAHLQNIREEERKRIGREIHDDLGQQLTAIKMDVAWIDKKIPKEEVPIKEKLKNIIGLLDGSNGSVRRILNELKPSILDEYGLLDALEWHANQFFKSTGIEVIIHSASAEIKLEESIATCIFRVFQEALTNIARHAKAKKVIVSIELIGNNIVVSIEDNGTGFAIEPALKKGSFGLLGMQERVRAVDGTLTIRSILNSGTTIRLSIPYK